MGHARALALLLAGSLACAVVVGGCGALTGSSAQPVDDGGVSAGDAAIPDGATPDGDASCGDLTTDDRNCGACGHDCLGTPCAAGMCQAELVGSYTSGAGLGEMTVGNGRLLWANGGTPTVCELPACATSMALVTTSAPVRMAITSSRYYWTVPDGLDSVGIAAGENSSNGANGIRGIFASGDDLFYTETDKVKVMPASSDVVTGIPSPPLEHVAVSGASVFFSRLDAPILAVDWDGSTTVKYPLPAGSEIVAAGQVHGIVALVPRTADIVYWAAAEGIGRATRSKQTPEVLVAGAAVSVKRMALDDAHVYVTTAAQEVVRFDLEGRDRLVLARAAGPVSVAVDATYVYYADQNGIWRVAK